MPRRFLLPLSLATFLILGVFFVTKSQYWLIADSKQPYVHWTLILDGQSRECERSDHAVSLWKKKQTSQLIVSGTRILRHYYNSQFVLPDMNKQGVPSQNLYEIRHNAYSTLSEAMFIIPQLRKRGIDTIQIITSDFHTARALKIYQHLAKGNPVIYISPASTGMETSPWWSSRQLFKNWILEWLRTLFTSWELYFTSLENPDKKKNTSAQVVPYSSDTLEDGSIYNKRNKE